MKTLRASLVFLSLAGAFLVPVDLGSSALATTVATCTFEQLSLSVGMGQAAAGNQGFPIEIKNRSASSCMLYGYPTLRLRTEKPSPRQISVVHYPRSQIYQKATPHAVSLAPKHVASFGISFVDADDQQFGNGARCAVDQLDIGLPTRKPSPAFVIRSSTTPNTFGGFNICFAGFTVGVTPLVTGTLPPQ